jgi:glycosyltransferase involved in cell wall biosynthesis
MEVGLMSNPDSPMKISVVMAAYNAEPWLVETIDSILQQTYPHFELLIVNDGSSDRSGEIIDEYAARDQRVKPIHHPNWGLCASLNHAIGLARHEWIARMDADDLMMPNRFERQVAFVQEHPDVTVSATLAHIIDSQGNLHWKTSTDLVDRAAYERYRRENRIMPLYHNTVFMRKSAIEATGGYRPEYYPAEDMDLWDRIADDTDNLILIQPEHLVAYRIHESSVSVAATRTQYLNLRWLKHSTDCRRSGRRELTRDEYLHYRSSHSAMRRLKNARELWSEVLYKNSTVLHVSGHRAKAMVPLVGSLFLYPSFWVSRMKSKFLKLGPHRPGLGQSQARNVSE